jgi:hypothetical protein
LKFYWANIRINMELNFDFSALTCLLTKGQEYYFTVQLLIDLRLFALCFCLFRASGLNTLLLFEWQQMSLLVCISH